MAASALLYAVLLCLASGLRINCGGGALESGVIEADSAAYYGVTGSYVGSFNRAGPTVYTSHSYAGSMRTLKYSVPAPNGMVSVKLHFAEVWRGAQSPGARLFNVIVSGIQVDADVDVWSRVGMNKPLVITVPAILAIDGRIEIQIVPLAGNAMISGIDVEEDDDDVNVRLPNVTWSQTGPLYPKRVFEAQGSILGSAANKYLVVIGGFFQFPGSTAQVWQLPLFGDANSRSWQRLADMPQKLTHMAQWSGGGEEICGVGGYRGPTAPGRSVNSAWCFNRILNLWRQLPNIPGNRAGGALVRITNPTRDVLLYAGGVDREQDNLAVHVDYGTTWQLDMRNDNASWITVGPDMPDPRNHMGAVESCGRYFFVGGQHEQDEHNGNRATVSEWLPANNTWSLNPPAAMPLPLGHISASILSYNCGIFVIGGITNGRTFVSHTLYWEPTQDKWHFVGEYPIEVTTPVCGVLGQQIWCATGGLWNVQNRVHVGVIS